MMLYSILPTEGSCGAWLDILRIDGSLVDWVKTFCISFFQAADTSVQVAELTSSTLICID